MAIPSYSLLCFRSPRVELAGCGPVDTSDASPTSCPSRAGPFKPSAEGFDDVAALSSDDFDLVLASSAMNDEMNHLLYSIIVSLHVASIWCFVDVVNITTGVADGPPA